MAMPTDSSFMDILFDRDDPMLKLIDDKNLINDKLNQWTNDDDDLLTNILSNNLDALGDDLGLDPTSDVPTNTWQLDDNLGFNIKNEPTSDCYSDSGYSNGQVSPGLPYDEYDGSPKREDDDDQMSSTISTTSDCSINQLADDEQNLSGVQPVEPPRKKVRQVMKVSPMLSSNPRSVLLPVNTASGMRTYRIITPSGGIKAIKPLTTNSQVIIKSTRPNIKPMIAKTNRINGSFKRVRSHNIKSLARNVADSDDEITVISEDEEARMYEKQQYPRLMLSPEERKLMQKEGVTLPTHYPLTKFEERELKRIRRKIRNKISAQDSRKRKKEYLDGLEDRVRQCTEENMSLVKKIKYLQCHNQSLVAQLKKLQAAMAAKTQKTAQPATCLLVLLLSMALVIAPNLRLTQPLDMDIAENDVAMPDNAPIAGRTRSLLSSEGVIEEEIISLGGEQEIPAELHELLRFHDRESSSSSGSDSSGSSRKSSWSWAEPSHFLVDHDYGPAPYKRRMSDSDKDLTDDHYGPPPVKRKIDKEFIIPSIDYEWPPPKIDDVLNSKKFLIPDIDEEWLPKSSGLMDKLDDTTEVKVNISDGTGTRTVVIQVPKEKK